MYNNKIITTMKTIVKSKTSAIRVAKNQLREKLNCKRLSYFRMEHSCIQCACGESYAIYCTGCHAREYEYVNIGICEVCGE